MTEIKTNKRTRKKIMNDISKSIDEVTILKIFRTKTNVNEVSKYLSDKQGIKIDYLGKNKLTFEASMKFLEEHWNYSLACEIAIELFKMKKDDVYINKKYATMIEAKDEYLKMLSKIEKGTHLDWSFAQGQFDRFAQRIMRDKKLTRSEKEIKIQEGVLNYLDMIEFNTARNDFIEYAMIENVKGLMPTLDHVLGVDYFIDGIPYDQKVSRSLGREFIKKFTSVKEAIKYAKENPAELANSLFENADSGRFQIDSNHNKLYFVFTNPLRLPSNIEYNILKNNFKPMDLTTQYYLKGYINDYNYKSILILI